MTHAVDVRRRERVAEEREDVALELLEALKQASRTLQMAYTCAPRDKDATVIRQAMDVAAAAIAKAEALNREGKR